MSALALKLIACAAMLADHIGYFWHIEALRAVGRIAFPIFLFLIYNGYRHTHSRVRYALRLGLFALLSQIPFSLCFSHTLWGGSGNVFFTLLLALLCIWAADSLSAHPVGRYFSLVPAIAVFGATVFGFIRLDNGTRAMVLAMVFWLFDGKGLWRKVLIAAGTVLAVWSGFFVSLGMNLARWILGAALVLPSLSRWNWIQLLSLLSLPLIFAYNGQKGRMPAGKFAARAAQWGFYLFYPAHLLLLWLINRFF